ncbi:MAG: hypothetical protein OQK77_11525 [Psychromonas sp.]|nr:hypothetical protein [Psychromonas sp.]
MIVTYFDNVEKPLLQVFSGFILKEEIQEIQKIFTEKNEKAMFIGTTTAGEISTGKVEQKSIVVSIFCFSSYFSGSVGADNMF